MAHKHSTLTDYSPPLHPLSPGFEGDACENETIVVEPPTLLVFPIEGVAAGTPTEVHIFASLTSIDIGNSAPSIHPSLSRGVRPSIHPSIHLSRVVCDHPSIHPPISLAWCATIHSSIHPSLSRGVRPSIHPSTHLSRVVCDHPFSHPSLSRGV
jgi:hypothetical protein